MLTIGGMTLYAKAQQGKTLHFTRLALGDGLLAGGSLVNRSALISERMSLLIDAVQLVNDSTDAAIIATLSNVGLPQGFTAREAGVFAEDPDTHQEVLYLYAHAGTEGEPIPDGNSGTLVYERLKLLVKLENTGSITFEGSGNPLYLVPEDVAPIVQTSLSGAAEKATLTDDDTLPLSDSADGSKLKKITFAKLKSTLKVYFDTLYNKYVHPTYTERLAGLYKVTVDDTGHISAVTAVQKTDITALGIPAQDTVTAIVDNLTSTDATKALSAKQGKALGDLIGTLSTDVAGKVPTSRKINEKALTSDITLSASDVGAIPSLVKSYADNGYAKIGDLIIQWNKVISSVTSGSFSVTFPITFPSKCLAVTNSGFSGSPGDFIPLLVSLNNSSCSLKFNSTSGGEKTFYIISIGY